MGYGGPWKWREDMRGECLGRRGTGFNVYIRRRFSVGVEKLIEFLFHFGDVCIFPNN